MDNKPAVSSEEKERKVRALAGEFSLALVKALIQTGYYSSEHPAAKVAISELYQKLREVTRDAIEITYTMSSVVDQRGVLIEGLTKEPIEMTRALHSIMGEHFIAKFHDYFVKNRVASLSIKRNIERGEFEKFIDIWMTWGTKLAKLDERHGAALMARELADKGIIGVSVVGMEEVPGLERKLPWPVRLAIARLRTDIQKVETSPFVKPQDKPRVRNQMIADIINGIRKAETCAEVLLNADLVAVVSKDLTPLEIEQAMALSVSAGILHEVAQILFDIAQIVLRGEEVQVVGRDAVGYKDCVMRVTRLVMDKLAQSGGVESYDLLEEAYYKGLVQEPMLPEPLRRRIRARELTKRFLEGPDLFLEDFDKTTNPKVYLKYLNVFSVIIPELMSRNDVEHLSRIFALIVKHYNEEPPPFVGRKRFIEETLLGLATEGHLEPLIALTVSAPKERRQPLEDGIALFKGQAVPYLVEMLVRAEDVGQRGAAMRVLQKIGEHAEPALIEELKAHRLPWYTVRNVITLLAQIGSKEAVAAIAPYRKHPNPKVREECVVALATLLGEASEKPLLEFLGDKDRAVRRRAIYHLSALRSTDIRFLRTILDIIRIRTKREEEPDTAAQIACLEALEQYEYQLLPEAIDFEGALLDIIKPKKWKLLLPGRFGVRKKPVEVVEKAIRALGAMGTGRSLPALADLLGHKDARIYEAAREAMDRIRARILSQQTQRPLKF
mgnify:CR=1 FL=1